MANDLEDIKRSYAEPQKYSEVQAGLPEEHAKIKTVGDLLRINYKLIGSHEQMRQNLTSRIRTGEPRYPGIIGFDDDVLPALDRAILAGHDIFLVGQIGQAKTRLAKSMAETLLSPIPVIQGSITNDCPMEIPPEMLFSLLQDHDAVKRDPVFYASPESEEKIRNNGLDTPVEWISGIDRFKYVLATPDISVKDLVGYIDAVKVAKKGVEMYKIDSYSPGNLMQAKHGILAIDELPVLDPRKQVALLSVLQEGLFTTGSYPVVFRPQIAFVATANPIDYTHSGKVIEPLYDRLKSHIHTHYPRNVPDEMAIILQEAAIPKSVISIYMLQTLASMIQNARSNPQINQERGISVRLGVHGLELLVGESERIRAIPQGALPAPRLSDMHCLSQVAKFELAEMDDTVSNRSRVFDEMLQQAIRDSCTELLGEIEPDVLESVRQEFAEKTFQISSKLDWDRGPDSYKSQLESFVHLKKLVDSKTKDMQQGQQRLEDLIKQYSLSCNIAGSDDAPESEMHALATEMVLEGLRWSKPKVLERREAGYVRA